jgi:DNA-damage-inducible protein D
MSEKKDGLLFAQQGECVIVKFLKKEVRKIFHKNEWWFCVVDIIEGLVETDRASSYWSDIKKKMEEKEGVTSFDFFERLKLPRKDGNPYPVDCSNIEGILRIIQSIPSKNAEPFKRWLAKTGFERIQEQNNPDLTIKRAILYYELQGRDKQWIQNRIDGQFTRNELTGEWKQRGVKEGQEYATLTNIISQETFGVSVSKHKEIKGLKKENLRDNMTNIELIFQRLGEEATIEVTRQRNSQGFEQNKKAARDGGSSAGEARKAYENKIGTKVVSSDKFIKDAQKDNYGLKDNELTDQKGKIRLSKKKG